jgi:sulfite reductase alpha subunit-like flavoprotein
VGIGIYIHIYIYIFNRFQYSLETFVRSFILGYDTTILDSTVRISKNEMCSFGGAIWVHSALLVGSLFCFVFHFIHNEIIPVSLQKSLPTNLFHGIQFAIFCLGDRCYGPDKFCVAGRKLMIRLRQLGAQLLVNPGYGDDSNATTGGGIFTDLDIWLQSALLPQLFPSNVANNCIESGAVLAPASGGTAEDKIVTIPPYRVQVSEDPAMHLPEEEWQMQRFVDSYQHFFEKQCPSTAYQYAVKSNTSMLQRVRVDSTRPGPSPPLLGRVTENRRITSPGWEQNTRHMQLVVTPRRTTTTTSDQSTSNNNGVSSQQQDPLHEEFWILEELSYQAGDVAAILPSNAVDEVKAFINVLPLHLQRIVDHELSIEHMASELIFSLADNTSRVRIDGFLGIGYEHWPTKCTLRGFLTNCADIHALPEREDLRALASYCSMISPMGQHQQEKLRSLSESKDSALYVDYILREKRSWVDVLFDFDSLRDIGSLLTIEVLLGLLTPIRPRLFSIASSPTKDFDVRKNPSSTFLSSSSPTLEFSIELCVAVVEGTTRLGRKYRGLCSNYLNQLPSETPSSFIRLWIQPGSFHGLPLEHTISMDENNIVAIPDRSFGVPILCIGAGTGVAPLRALIHEREAVLNLSSCGSSSIRKIVKTQGKKSHESDAILVFGCRKKDSDFYYEEEWSSLIKSGRMTLLTAFSQDQWHKVYVQQVLANELGRDQIVKHIFDCKGAIYIAGGPKMVRAAIDVIIESISDHLKCEAKEARRILTNLQTLGMYSVEAWS